jgi:hypothetical protein
MNVSSLRSPAFTVWPTAMDHRSLGQRPRKEDSATTVLAEGHVQYRWLACLTIHEIGLRAIVVRFGFVPGALPQATVTKGLRPNIGCVQPSAQA